MYPTIEENNTINKLRNKTGVLAVLCLIYLNLTTISHADINTARTYLQQGKAESALLELEGDIVSNGQDPEARFLKGVALQALKRNDEAIEIYSALAQDFPELPEPYNNLAVLWADKKEFDKAENALHAAIKTNKSYSTAYENLGDIYAQRASIAYADALSHSPSNPSAVQIKLSMIDNILLPPTARKPAQTRKTVNTKAVADKPSPNTSHNTVKATNNSDANSNMESSIIRDSVFNWAKTWASQDVNAYFANYADTFRPTGGISRAAWVKNRTRRLRTPDFIRVDISDLRIEPLNNKHVRAKFLQNYKSPGYQDTVRKSLLFVNTPSGWKIQSEQSQTY